MLHEVGIEDRQSSSIHHWDDPGHQHIVALDTEVRGLGVEEAAEETGGGGDEHQGKGELGHHQEVPGPPRARPYRHSPGVNP